MVSTLFLVVWRRYAAASELLRSGAPGAAGQVIGAQASVFRLTGVLLAIATGLFVVVFGVGYTLGRAGSGAMMPPASNCWTARRPRAGRAAAERARTAPGRGRLGPVRGDRQLRADRPGGAGVRRPSGCAVGSGDDGSPFRRHSWFRSSSRSWSPGAPRPSCGATAKTPSRFSHTVRRRSPGAFRSLRRLVVLWMIVVALATAWQVVSAAGEAFLIAPGGVTPTCGPSGDGRRPWPALPPPACAAPASAPARTPPSPA